MPTHLTTLLIALWQALMQKPLFWLKKRMEVPISGDQTAVFPAASIRIQSQFCLQDISASFSHPSAGSALFNKELHPALCLPQKI